MLSNDKIQVILDSWANISTAGSIPRTTKLPDPKPDLATVIQGVRRCGKSTLLKQYAEEKNLSPDERVFVNFEDPRFADILNYELLDAIVAVARLRRPNGSIYFFLDEVQEVALWEKWLYSQLERPGENLFIITGSNASLLSGELGSNLTGRYRKVELFPFDFREARHAEPQLELYEFLKRGGFPRPFLDQDPFLLGQYFDDIIEKDVLRRLALRGNQVIRTLAKMVYESCGSELSLRKLAGTAGVAAETVGSYLDAFELAYLVFSCSYYSLSERKRSRRNKKYYPVDTGLRRAVITRTGADFGKDFEAQAYLQLRKRYMQSVYYWRDKGEVDFVVDTGNSLVPIQVTTGEIKDRHERGLENFYQHFPHAREAVFLTPQNIGSFTLE